MATSSVRFGLSLPTAHPPTADPQQCVRDLLERVQLARDVGFHSVWVGDHHVTPHHYLQNLPMIVRISAISGHMQIGALFMLPLFHPILLAEQIATLDVICEGRFTLKTARGAQQDAHDAFGIPWRERAGRFEECLDIMRKLWTQDQVTHEGKYWRFSNVTINPKPVQNPLPVWLGADADRPVRRAARLADGWLIAPWLWPELCQERIAFYRQALQECGRTVAELPIRRDIYVAPDLATAKRHTDPVIQGGYRGFTGDRLRALIIGGPEEAIAEVERYRAMGCNHFLFRHIVREQSQMLSSIQLIGEKIIPHFSYSIG
jgi:alkanesulfonate monooxygenase SsuD/methylene tetrahydromethanopterin reductase-like flavin-dependent oxidoreductase (luciferase family)